jgi:hypothetical protein
LTQPQRDPVLQDLARRVLESGKFDLVQIWFESAVLDRYRDDPDTRILRTDSAGRLRGPGGWMVNFGISPDDALIHMPVATAIGIPESQRAHWLEHVVGLPAGDNFLRMAMTPGACIDDGQTRDW